MQRSKDGIYRTRGNIFAFKYRGRDGQWREKSTGACDRATAKVVRQKFLEQFECYRAAAPKEWANKTVRQAADEWLGSMHAGVDLSGNTIRSYRACLNWVVAILGSKKLAGITIEDLRAYRSVRRDAGCANVTINHELLCLSYVLKRARLWKLLAEDYKPLPIGQRHSSRVPLTVEELNRLVAAAMENPAWEVCLNVALLAAQTTCRPVEIAGLQLGRISLHPCPMITISRVTTKTAAGAREIPLNRVAQLAVRRLLERAWALGACDPEHYLLPADLSKHTKPGDPVYPRRKDGFDPALHQRGWYSSWDRLRKKAGLPGSRPPAGAARRPRLLGPLLGQRPVSRRSRIRRPRVPGPARSRRVQRGVRPPRRITRAGHDRGRPLVVAPFALRRGRIVHAAHGRWRCPCRRRDDPRLLFARESVT